MVAATDGIAADPGGGEPDGVERVVRAAGDQAVAKSYRQFGRVGLLAVHDQRQAVVGGGGDLCDVVLPEVGGGDDPLWAAVRGRAAAQAACRRSRRLRPGDAGCPAYRRGPREPNLGWVGWCGPGSYCRASSAARPPPRPLDADTGAAGRSTGMPAAALRAVRSRSASAACRADRVACCQHQPEARPHVGAGLRHASLFRHRLAIPARRSRRRSLTGLVPIRYDSASHPVGQARGPGP